MYTTRLMQICVKRHRTLLKTIITAVNFRFFHISYPDLASTVGNACCGLYVRRHLSDALFLEVVAIKFVVTDVVDVILLQSKACSRTRVKLNFNFLM